MENKIYGLIGLAAKAGKLTSGGNTCEDAIKKGKAGLVIIAVDSTDNTKDKFLRIAENNRIESRLFGSSDNLGKYCGKREKRSVIAINDKGFAERLAEIIDESTRKNGGGRIGKDQGL